MCVGFDKMNSYELVDKLNIYLRSLENLVIYQKWNGGLSFDIKKKY